MRYSLIFSILLLALPAWLTCAQAPDPKSDGPAANTAFTPSKEIVYKKVADLELKLYVFEPTERSPGKTVPGIVLFHGGAWSIGQAKDHFFQADYWAKRGLWACSADYRLIPNEKKIVPCQVKGTKIPDEIEDAKDAMRYVREHAAELGVNPDMLVAGGGSAGGHLAVATALTPDPESDAPKKISCKPNLLLLYNPGTLYPDAHDTVRLIYFTKDTQPAIQFFGSNDTMLETTGKPCLEQAKKVGCIMETYVADGAGHGFFKVPPWDDQTLYVSDQFLVKQGYLTGSSPIKLPDGVVLKELK